MSITIQTSESQATGAFDGGNILEKKPIGFPQDGGEQKPYSTLFYWAHAWSDQGGLIGEHPHQGFEIMSFVLTGTIEHYDSKLQGWKKLKAGDVQIIRSGNGITHAEKINANSSIFQIWFDPDLSKTLSLPASYDDYESSKFPVLEDEESRVKILVGEAPVTMNSKVDYIQEITFKVDEKHFELKSDSVYSLFILEGSLSLNDHALKKGDFACIRQEALIKLTDIDKGSRIFIIKTPADPGFLTYAKRAGWTNN